MKKVILAVAISSLSFGAIANSHYTGHRVGAGLSGLTLSESGFDLKMDTGFKLEYGYDINNIFGVNTSYAMNSKGAYGVDYDFNTFKIDTDIGYTFDLGELWLKPYGAIGLAYGNEKISDRSGSLSASDSSLFLGMGVRAQSKMGVYADLRYDMSSYDGFDADSLSFTVGYRF
ncbi:porin family protein [Vibrio maritimus]|uniref:porin family protein n=1 Tax=Vibrio maritimus TaxID=990268 RepID=UPI001F41204C|nr:porin family protein [Vibrio maritimus]